MVCTIEGFFEVAIESWPEWDLNPLLKYSCVKDKIKQKTHFCKIAIFRYVK